MSEQVEQVYVLRLTEEELVRLRRMYMRMLDQHPIARVPVDKDIEAKLSVALDTRPLEGK